LGYWGDSLLTAFELILGFDREVRMAVWTSLYTSSCSIVIAALLGVPIGLWLGLNRFRGRQVMIALLNTLMALPTVVVGLLLFGLFSRQGPLGPLGLLFTPMAMIAGQMVLAAPIVANLVLAAVTGADQRIINTALTLGASRLQAAIQLLREIRFGVMAAVIAGFGWR